MSFSHPIHDKNFFKISKKTCLSRNLFTIGFNEKEENSFFPNIVVLPLIDFQLNVSVVELGKPTNKSKYSKYFSLRNFKEKKNIKIQCEEVTLDAEIIQDKTEQ